MTKIAIESGSRSVLRLNLGVIYVQFIFTGMGVAGMSILKLVNRALKSNAFFARRWDNFPRSCTCSDMVWTQAMSYDRGGNRKSDSVDYSRRACGLKHHDRSGSLMSQEYYSSLDQSRRYAL